MPDNPEKTPLTEPANTPEVPAAPAHAATAGEAEGASDEQPRRKRRRRRRGRGGRAGASQPTLHESPPATGEQAHYEAEPPDGADAGEEPEQGAGPAAERAMAPERREEERERPAAAALRDDGQPADIDPLKLDVDGIKILNRLHQFGHQAYFVGGCVRDLLLGRLPKDFDIATSAHPGEVRSLFKNCRLIGRRFRLAHVYFRGGKIIEVSTFRANPSESTSEDEEAPSDDLLITRDNVFGTAEQDARRRDFTVNGLFYDIRQGRVIDYVAGRPDLDARVMRTIGNPEIRMREDPVRILRAIRFAARLGFEIDPSTYAAMEGAVEDLPRCAPARLLEEVFRLLRGGSARESFRLLHALGALDILLPPIAAHLEKGGEAAEKELLGRLAALDARMRSKPLEDALIIAALLAPLTRGLPEPEAEQTPRGRVIDALLEDMVQTARLPRRIADRVRELLWAKGVLRGERKRRRSLSSFRNHPAFRDALLLLEIAAEASGEGQELVERWKSGNPGAPRPAPESPEEGPARKKRRRRGRRRREGAPQGPEAGASAPPEPAPPPPSGGDESH